MKYLFEHGANVNVQDEVSTNFNVLREKEEDLKSVIPITGTYFSVSEYSRGEEWKGQRWISNVTRLVLLELLHT